MEVTWMSPNAVPRIDYLRWKFGYRPHMPGWYPGHFIFPPDRHLPGISEARAVRRRLCTGKSVSRGLARWAFRETVAMAREYERYLYC